MPYTSPTNPNQFFYAIFLSHFLYWFSREPKSHKFSQFSFFCQKIMLLNSLSLNPAVNSLQATVQAHSQSLLCSCGKPFHSFLMANRLKAILPFPFQSSNLLPFPRQIFLELLQHLLGLGNPSVQHIGSIYDCHILDLGSSEQCLDRFFI